MRLVGYRGVELRLAPERGHCIFPTLTEPIGEPAPAAALAGVRVLDLATLFPAPMVAAMLGDLGADVVKVEPPGGDPLRVTGAMRGDRTFVWALADRNKRALSVDFDTADGVALVQRLTAVADVVVLNQPPRVLERWGCTYDDDRGAQPRRDRGAGHRIRCRRAQRRPARERHRARGLRGPDPHDRRGRRPTRAVVGADRRLHGRVLRRVGRARGAVLARRAWGHRPAHRREPLRSGAAVPRPRDGGVVAG